MSTSIYHLPDYFAKPDGDVLYYFYSSHRSSVKNKVIFTQNAISILTDGEKEVFYSGRKFTVDKQTILLINPGSMLMTEKLSESSNYKSIIIFFNNDFLSRFCLKYNIQQNRSLSENKADASLCVVNKDAFLLNYESSLQLLGNVRDHNLRQVKLEELLVYLIGKSPELLNSFISNSLPGDPGRIIKQTVSANLDNNLSIDELAFLCHMSSSTFKRHFQSIFETSPKKYSTSHKMQKAKQLLENNKKPSEIYADLGYENLSSFSTEFKKFFGCAPTHLKSEPKEKVFELSA